MGRIRIYNKFVTIFNLFDTEMMIFINFIAVLFAIVENEFAILPEAADTFHTAAFGHQFFWEEAGEVTYSTHYFTAENVSIIAHSQHF